MESGQAPISVVAAASERLVFSCGESSDENASCPRAAKNAVCGCSHSWIDVPEPAIDDFTIEQLIRAFEQ